MSFQNAHKRRFIRIAAYGIASDIRISIPYWLFVCVLFHYCGAFALPAQADKLLVIKSKHQLLLLQNGSVMKTYAVCLGRNPVGHKMQRDDNRTPEGNYIIDFRNPKSSYHLSLHISYPNRNDSMKAKLRGVSPGGAIMIHGFPAGITPDDVGGSFDWTKGCIAVSNAAIEEIWQLVPDGTPIEIIP